MKLREHFQTECRACNVALSADNKTLQPFALAPSVLNLPTIEPSDRSDSWTEISESSRQVSLRISFGFRLQSNALTIGLSTRNLIDSSDIVKIALIMASDKSQAYHSRGHVRPAEERILEAPILSGLRNGLRRPANACPSLWSCRVHGP